MRILNRQKASNIRKNFIDNMINKNCEYYINNIHKLHSFKDGFCYIGYLWDCFNFFEQNDTSSFELVNDKSGGAHLRNCFSERIKAARSWECLPRRYVHIGNSNKRYPISLPFGDFYAFSKKIKSSF